MRRILPFMAALAFAGPSLALDGETLRVDLERTDLPTASTRSLFGINVRSTPGADMPEGFDNLFFIRPGGGKDGPAVRILHKGWNPDEAKLYFWPEGGDPVEIPRMRRRINPYYVGFGAVKMGWLPFSRFHFYFPRKNVERWRQYPTKTLYVMPSECLAGKVTMHGKSFRVALVDRNLNGAFDDPCEKHARDGDWFLFDENGDGRFDLNYSSTESMGITQCVRFAGATWSLAVSGATLTLRPVSLATCRVKFRGLSAPCTIHGWSHVTGSIQARLDPDGAIEIPRGDWLPYSYQWSRGNWRLSASLRSLGVQKAPAPGETVEFVLGPKLEFSLTANDQKDGKKVTFRCLGRGGESVTLYRDGKRVPPPVLVVLDDKGQERSRHVMKYG